MVEIKVDMTKPIPAQEAKPAMPAGFTVTVNGYQVVWKNEKMTGMYLYWPHWCEGTATSADIRKFSIILNDIADTLDAQEKANGR